MKTTHRNLRSYGLLLIFSMLFGFSANYSFSSDAPKEVLWDALIPEDWNPDKVFDQYSDEEFTAMSDEQYFMLQDEVQKMLDEAPTVDALDGQDIKIPGYLLPLEFDKTKIKEFLLVPYFGACMHTPPPPANQIIHGKLQSAFTLKELYEPVWISGKLKAIRSQTKLGEAGIVGTIDVDTGYTMEVDKVEPYQEQN